MKIQRILAATDLSPCAAYAETRAAMLCAEIKLERLGLITVVEPGVAGKLERLLEGVPGAAEVSLMQRTWIDLKRASARLKSETGIACDCFVESGRPASVIAEKAEKLSAELIVAGEHGCGSVTGVFLGNTPYRLLHTGRRPLLVVRNQPEHPYRSILVPVDFSDDSMLAAQIALALSPHAEVTLLHAFEAVNEGMMHYAGVSREYIDEYRAGAREAAVLGMERFMEKLGSRERPVRSDIRLGAPAFVIQEYVEKSRPELIVIGKHGNSRIEDILIGSVTRHAMDDTDCDILVAIGSRDADGSLLTSHHA